MALKSTFAVRPPRGKVVVKCRHCGAEHVLARSSGDPAGTSTGWRNCPKCNRLKDGPPPEAGQFGQDIRWVWPDGQDVALRDWYVIEPATAREAIAKAS